MMSYIRMGAVAGILIGILFMIFTSVIFIPIMEQAEVYDHHTGKEIESHTHPASHSISNSIVNIDIITLLGNFAWVVTLGILTSIGFYFSEPMLQSLERHWRGLLVGLTGFVATRVVTWPVYFPVSPATDLALPESIYIPWYWAITGVTVCTFFSTPFLYRHLTQKYKKQTAKFGTAAVGLIPVAVVILAPANSVTSVSAPIQFHYRFMMTVVGGQLAVWLGLGLFIGHFAGIELSSENQCETAQNYG